MRAVIQVCGITVRNRDDDARKVTLLAVFKDVAFVVVCGGEFLKRPGRVGLVKSIRKVERLQKVFLSIAVSDDIGDREHST